MSSAASLAVAALPFPQGASFACQAAIPRAHGAAAWKRQRRACEACHDHPALFRYRGEVRADRTHRLCFRCYRALRDAVRHGRTAPPDRHDVYESLRRRRAAAQIAARHALALAAGE